MAPSPGNTIAPLFFVSFLQFQIVVADVESAALQYIASHLLPNECQSVIAEPFNIISPTSESHKSSTNEINCFRKLTDWESNLRTKGKTPNLVLGNRLHKIGRDDLVAVLLGRSSGDNASTEEIVEYESWDSGEESSRNTMSPTDPTVSETDRLIYGSRRMKSIAGLSPEFHQQSISISSFPGVRKLTGIHSPDSFKDHSMVMGESESEHSGTSGPGYATAEPAGHRQGHGDLSGTSTPKENNGKDSKASQTASAKTPEDKKHNKSKFAQIFPHFSDEKTAPCLRVPLSTALVVIGTIMILTCCCALLLRNRLVACFEKLRGKKTNNKTSKRVSTDEEQGFMGPRTVGKAPKRSGRKGGGPADVANIGIQKSSTASNGSRDSEEKTTGCCACCTKKKKKNRRKRKN